MLIAILAVSVLLLGAFVFAYSENTSTPRFNAGGMMAGNANTNWDMNQMHQNMVKYMQANNVSSQDIATHVRSCPMMQNDGDED